MMGWRGGWLADGAPDPKLQPIHGWCCQNLQCPGFQAGKTYYMTFEDSKSRQQQVCNQAEGGKLMFLSWWYVVTSGSCHLCRRSRLCAPAAMRSYGPSGTGASSSRWSSSRWAEGVTTLHAVLPPRLCR